MINGKGACAYATRTILIKYGTGDLEPWAIEVSSPHFQDAFLSFGSSHWGLAKAHVAANDSAHHHLVSHWLHTHAVIEPFIIGTRRQLSVMHPVHQLLDPHFKDTLHINALARRFFLNAGGILETMLFTAQFSMIISSDFYKRWRFQDQALPNDLLKRRMATETGASKELLLEYYPYAMDGSEIWEAIETWVREYCNIFYKSEDNSVEEDVELQAWWSEIRDVGHGDQKEGWYPLTSLQDLTKALTTLIWIASGLHAAVNFGQYAYAGWPPNRPMRLRKPIPIPNTDTGRREDYLPDDETYPEKFEMAFAMAVMDVLSRHTSEEVYLGQRPPRGNVDEWRVDHGEVNERFIAFRKKLEEIEENIRRRNKHDGNYMPRECAKIPYRLLCPDVSKTKLEYSMLMEEKEGLRREGISGRGIPNSISI